MFVVLLVLFDTMLSLNAGISVSVYVTTMADASATVGCVSPLTSSSSTVSDIFFVSYFYWRFLILRSVRGFFNLSKKSNFSSSSVVNSLFSNDLLLNICVVCIA